MLYPKVMEQICNTASDLEFVQKMDLDGIAVGLDSKNTVIDDRHFIDEWGITRVSYDEYPNPVGFPIQELSDLDTYEAVSYTHLPPPAVRPCACTAISCVITINARISDYL